MSGDTLKPRIFQHSLDGAGKWVRGNTRQWPGWTTKMAEATIKEVDQKIPIRYRGGIKYGTREQRFSVVPTSVERDTDPDKIQTMARVVQRVLDHGISVETLEERLAAAQKAQQVIPPRPQEVEEMLHAMWVKHYYDPSHRQSNIDPIPASVSVISHFDPPQAVLNLMQEQQTKWHDPSAATPKQRRMRCRENKRIR